MGVCGSKFRPEEQFSKLLNRPRKAPALEHEKFVFALLVFTRNNKVGPNMHRYLESVLLEYGLKTRTSWHPRRIVSIYFPRRHFPVWEIFDDGRK